jgi:hypothetical protein
MARQALRERDRDAETRHGSCYELGIGGVPGRQGWIREAEVTMYARTVLMQLKPNKMAEFTQTLEEKILPVLRKQKGFQDELAFIGTDGKTALGVSLWDKIESAEIYNRESFPTVIKMLSTVVEGIPKVSTYELSNSTFHKIAAKLTV